MDDLKSLSKKELAEQLETSLAGLADSEDKSKMQQLAYNLQTYQIELEMQNRELREAQSRLEESSNRYADLYDFAPIGYLTLDTKGCITEINLTGARMLGIERARIIGQPMTLWLTPEYRKIFLDHISDVFTNEDKTVVDMKVKHQVDEVVRNVQFESVLSTDNSGNMICHTAMIDINDRKQFEAQLILAREKAEDAEKSNQAKSMFLSNMSHELRTPLTSIIGFSESLKTDDLDEQDRDRLISTIIRNGQHLLLIINDILDLSKIEANQMDVELIDTSVFLLMGEVDSLLGFSARDKGLTFKITYHFPFPKSIVTDPTHLKQILVNLCGNAIKFTDEGGIEVDVSCSSDYKQVYFKVSDSGIGMTHEELSHVYSPFSQADSSTSRKYGGTGLGLPISSRLAQALGGELTCESKYGQGSLFNLSIANHDENETVVVNSIENVSSYVEGQHKMMDIRALRGSILVVEDSPDNQQLISMYIRKTGARVIIAQNGKQATEITQTEEFDLILMDMQMPVMDGLEAISRIRACGYTRPIVALTANAMLSDREICEAAGADGYLTKPIDLNKFYHILNSYLTEDTDRRRVEESRKLQKTMQESPNYKAIIDRFLDKLPQMLDQIGAAFTEKNWDELQAKSHELKGIGGALGYPEITELAGQINTLVKQQSYEQLDDACIQLETLCHGILHKNSF